MPRKSNASHMMDTNKCHVFLPLFLSNTHELANSLVYRIVLNKTSEQILEPKKKKKASISQVPNQRNIYLFSGSFMKET